MRQKVLLLARELDVGGSERQMVETARGLDRSRFAPCVGCFRAEGIRADELRAASVPVVQFPVRSFRSPAALRGAWQLAHYIHRENIRLVHTFDYPMAAFGVPVARLLTRAVVVSSQRSHRELIPGIYARLVPMTDRLAHAVMVNCQFLKRHLMEDYSVAAAKIRLCYNGIDLEQFHPAPSPRRAGVTIGVVCALRPEKGLLTLLDAFAKIRRPERSPKLILVGSGEMLPRLEARADELGIRPDCTFHPATQSVASWYRSIDIFVLPSLSEALSNSLMEAMACGCCCIASNVGGNPELIVDGDRGLLFPAGDADALAAALRALLEDESRRLELAGNGARFLRENFSLVASARCMGDTYQELLEETR